MSDSVSGSTDDGDDDNVKVYVCIVYVVCLFVVL